MRLSSVLSRRGENDGAWFGCGPHKATSTCFHVPPRGNSGLLQAISWRSVSPQMLSLTANSTYNWRVPDFIQDDELRAAVFARMQALRDRYFGRIPREELSAGVIIRGERF